MTGSDLDDIAPCSIPSWQNAPLTSGLQGRAARLGALSASYSTPDLCFSPSGTSIVQSISVPSLASASDLTSSSYSSIPVSNSSYSTSSVHAAHSMNRMPYGFHQFEEGRAVHSWFSNSSPILPPPSQSDLSSRRRRRPLSTLGKITHGRMRPLINQLPQTFWERLVLVVFCVYVVVLARALLGIGRAPATISSTCLPAGSPVTSASPLNALEDSLHSASLEENISQGAYDLNFVAPAGAVMSAQQILLPDSEGHPIYPSDGMGHGLGLGPGTLPETSSQLIALEGLEERKQDVLSTESPASISQRRSGSEGDAEAVSNEDIECA